MHLNLNHCLKWDKGNHTQNTDVQMANTHPLLSRQNVALNIHRNLVSVYISFWADCILAYVLIGHSYIA